MNVNAISQVIKKLSISDVNILKENFPLSQDLHASCQERMNPLGYLSATFKYVTTLLSVTFDVGGGFTGPRAVEFFIPGSAPPNARWELIVPGYKESVADMVTALSISGVTWELYGQDIIEDLQEKGIVTVSRRKMIALSTWAHAPLERPAYLLGEKLCSVLRQFDMGFHMDHVSSNSFTIQLQENGEINIFPNEETLSYEDTTYEDSFGRPFSVLHGTISTARGVENVDLIIGCYDKGITGCLEFMKNYYASHLQAFIGGWCAAHMYYQQASVKHSILWEPTTNYNTVNGGRTMGKYQSKSFTFTQANTSTTRIRRFGDNESLFLDYGELWRSFISQHNYEILDRWLDDRRKNLHGVSWVESGGRILDISSDWEQSFRTCRKTFIEHISELPGYQQRRLGNMVSLDTQSPDPMRSKGFQSSVGRNVMKQGWQMIVLARSGTVCCNLRDATPWSWVF
ncbi:hypothetical protein M441DRAFT_154555 [Trichoderma asperellum CBS 433.97]|uniref:Uncharacterized protein n=1 Tax=Trichoderma asperellum (strain ATCC 204424 / CBS 433.97 / NBRC 101777) TaxID=1042311 RepID=A0A2T3YQS6_TRIA4|nr:hypothetical protein M441DRAFT_154555 [Trichoderma asperellum CBS 433.97]PTB34925.1 hypothetical protein M441DRAFT_154555 [Trichoderma asperellum CBS 433.97]